MSSATGYTKAKVFASKFSEWVLESNIPGLAIGGLVSSTVLDMSRTLVDAIVMPLVDSIRTGVGIDIDFDTLINSVLSGIVVLFVAYAIISFTGLRQAKPVTWVKVIE